RQEMLLGNVSPYLFPSPQMNSPVDQDAERLPLRPLWEEWFAGRADRLRDRDGCELLRAALWVGYASTWHEWNEKPGEVWQPFLKYTVGGPKCNYAGLAASVLHWLIRLHPPAEGPRVVLDMLESAFALVPREVVERKIPHDAGWDVKQHDWRTW